MEGLQRSRQKQQRRRQEGRKGPEEEAGEQEQGAVRAAEAAVTEGPRAGDGASRGAGLVPCVCCRHRVNVC